MENLKATAHVHMNVEKYIQKCEAMIRRGESKEKIKKKIGLKNIDEIYEIARCRIKAKGKFSVKELYFDEYGLRYSTPEIIGRYRANRIKNMKIADISCGVGLQAIFYSFTNVEVLGVDINGRRIKYARENAKRYGAKNIKFIAGNCFSDEIFKIVRNYDVLFSDPARDETEEERKLSTLHPSPLKIMEKYGERDYVFDLPPQLSLNKIPKEWEKEFISLNGKILRFTTYVGDLKRHDRIAVALPSGVEFWSDLPLNECKENIEIKSGLLSDYIYLVDESLYYAQLLGEFGEKYEIKYLQVGKRRTLATGNHVKNDFLKAFRVICHGTSLENVIECMRKEEIGKTTLRFSLPPHEYWKMRKKIEERLKGDKKGSIFKIGGMWVGTENET